MLCAIEFHLQLKRILFPGIELETAWSSGQRLTYFATGLTATKGRELKRSDRVAL